MRTIPEIIAELAETERSIQDAKDLQRELCAELVHDHAPYRIGEIAETRREAISITRVSAKPHWEHGALWEIEGHPLKKDGNPGARTTSFVRRCIPTPY